MKEIINFNGETPKDEIINNQQTKIKELESEVERLKNHVTTDNSKVNENLLKENKDLKECLKTVRSQLFDKNNKETLLTNIIDETLNNN